MNYVFSYNNIIIIIFCFRDIIEEIIKNKLSIYMAFSIAESQFTDKLRFHNVKHIQTIRNQIINL
jgi:hypothetical protein